MLPFYKLKLVILLFFDFENIVLPAERRGFPPPPKKKHFYKLKIRPIMLRNMLGPGFNLYLDQF